MRRHDFPGAWHHVMNRGARREPVFHQASDGQRFLDLVAEWSERRSVEIHAYCLMPNHFHLLVRSLDADLGRFLQQVGSAYTRDVNRRLGHDGAIFRGRYRSRPVDSDGYLTTAARYIHRNPLDLRPTVELDQYRWSSYGAYVGTTPAPPWLRTDILLASHGNDHAALRDRVEGPAGPIDVDQLERIVATALDEQHLDVDAVRLERLMLIAVAAELDPQSATEVERLLTFPTIGAERAARSRARKRIETDPALRRVLTRTLDVAA